MTLLNLLDLSMPIVNAILAALIGFLLARKKNATEVKKMEAETEFLEISKLEKISDLWREEANALRQEVINLRKEVAALKEENSQLRETIQQLKEMVPHK